MFGSRNIKQHRARVNTINALLLYAIGFIQRDGGAILLGHLANIGTIVYFSVLIGGGGVAVRELFQRLTG